MIRTPERLSAQLDSCARIAHAAPACTGRVAAASATRLSWREQWNGHARGARPVACSMTSTLAGATPPPAGRRAGGRRGARGRRPLRVSPQRPARRGLDGRRRTPARGVLCLLRGRITNLETLASPSRRRRLSRAILAAAYRRGGEAIARWPARRVRAARVGRAAGRGLLARDRLGARPLFFSRTGGTLCFASEVRTVLALAPRRPGPNRAAVVQWLGGGALRGGATLYEGVEHAGARSSPPARRRTCGDGRYWAPAMAGRARCLARSSSGDSGKRSPGRVDRSLAGNDAAGILLSGGLDSRKRCRGGDGGARAAACERRRILGGVSPPSLDRRVGADRPPHAEAGPAQCADRGARRQHARECARVPGGVAAAAQRPNNFFIQPLLRQAAEDGRGDRARRRGRRRALRGRARADRRSPARWASACGR